jgi:hypothetical protein
LRKPTSEFEFSDVYVSKSPVCYTVNGQSCPPLRPANKPSMKPTYLPYYIPITVDSPTTIDSTI